MNYDPKNKPIAGSRDRTELGMISTNSLDSMTTGLDLLSRAHFGHENVVMNHPGWIIPELFFLSLGRHPFEGLRVNGALMIELIGFRGRRRGIAVLRARDVQIEDDVSGRIGLRLLITINVLIDADHLRQWHFEESRINFKGQEAQAMTENLVLDDARVLIEVDLLEGHCWHLNPIFLSKNYEK